MGLIPRNKKKKAWNLAFWLVPPNLLLTSGMETEGKNKNGDNTTTEPRADQVITPTVAPKPEMPDARVKVTTTADFIWWKSFVGNAEYAWAGVTDGRLVTVGDSLSKGNIKTPDFDFAPGFKLGLGLNFLHDGWDLYGNYTWLAPQSETTSVIGQQGVGLIGNFNPNTGPYDGFGPPALTSANSKWKQNFNVLDVELGRNFFISRFITLRPFFGLKFDWIKEEFHDQLFSNTTNFQSIDLKRLERAFGVGIRAGLDTVWHFTKNWGLYGDFAATALWSDFHTTILENAFNSSGLAEGINSYEKIQQVTPVFEASLGLIYMLWFNQNRTMFFAKAGWEEQVWVHYNQITPSIFNVKAGNLSLHGLTVEIGFTF